MYVEFILKRNKSFLVPKPHCSATVSHVCYCSQLLSLVSLKSRLDLGKDRGVRTPGCKQHLPIFYRLGLRTF